MSGSRSGSADLRRMSWLGRAAAPRRGATASTTAGTSSSAIGPT